MKRGLFLIVIKVVFLSSVSCQIVQKMIDDVINLPIYKLYTQYSNDLIQLKSNYPIIEEINFRTETDQNNLARQEYALRSIFNGFGLKGAYKKQKDILSQKVVLEMEEHLHHDLYSVYIDVIKMYFLAKQDSFILVQRNYDEKKLNHLIQIIGTGANVSAKDVLKLEENIYQFSVDQDVINKALYSLYTKYNIKISPLQLMSIDELTKKVDMLSFDQNQTFAYRKSLLDIDESTIDYQLKRKDGRRILDYAQIRYSRRDNLFFQDEFSLGLGLRLPYKGSLAVDKTSLFIDKMDVDFKRQVGFLEKIATLGELKRNFYEKLNEIKFFHTSQDKIFNSLNTQHPETAEEITFFKNDLKLKTEVKINAIEKELWMLYLEMMLILDKITPNSIEMVGTA